MLTHEQKNNISRVKVSIRCPSDYMYSAALKNYNYSSSAFGKVSTSCDVCWNAGDGCQLPSCQPELGPLSGGLSGCLRRASEGDEEVSDDTCR